MCAELGIMRITEQVDALECMAISPYKFLLAPKLIAGLLSVPLLTMVFDVVALFGGYFVGVVMFGVADGSYMNGMTDAVKWEDVRLGLVQSVIFGGLVTLICCAKGFYLHLSKAGSQGAEGVSSVTTDAVVLSSISVLFSDFLHFRDCFTGPGGNVSPDDLCAVHDINQDGSIDETDFQYFLEAYDDVLVDCNGSGNPDIVDIILGNSTDNNGNGIPDECDANPYDLDDNGIVNGADLAIMLGNWGPCTQPAHLCIGDFNADGQVDGADLAILLGNWG